MCANNNGIVGTGSGRCHPDDMLVGCQQSLSISDISTWIVPSPCKQSICVKGLIYSVEVPSCHQNRCINHGLLGVRLVVSQPKIGTSGIKTANTAPVCRRYTRTNHCIDDTNDTAWSAMSAHQPRSVEAATRWISTVTMAGVIVGKPRQTAAAMLLHPTSWVKTGMQITVYIRNR